MKSIYGSKNLTVDKLTDIIKNTKDNLFITHLNLDTYSKAIDNYNVVKGYNCDLFFESTNSADFKITNRPTYIKDAHTFFKINAPMHYCPSQVLVVSGGHADQPVADETIATLIILGIHYDFLPDIGVNDLAKTNGIKKHLSKSSVIISIQGFEGALPIVLAGMTDLPIISVPTSTGYGLSNSGKSALMTSLTSCAPGIATMNIDNGFGAAMFASRILKQI